MREREGNTSQHRAYQGRCSSRTTDAVPQHGVSTNHSVSSAESSTVRTSVLCEITDTNPHSWYKRYADCSFVHLIAES